MHLTSRPLALSVAGAALAGVVAAVAPLGAVGAAAPAAPGATTTVAAAKAPPADKTSAVEKRRVDSVPAPTFAWKTCRGTAQCATVKLPLDYDKPRGAKVSVAVLRVKAADPAKRVGTLFVNPGGPGGSSTSMAAAASSFLGKDVLDRFDVVGVDPRGIADSENVRCFTSADKQAEALAGFSVPFPIGAAEEKAFIASSKKLGRACSTTGKRLAGHMSTAEVARDMDVVRRALGDKKLTFLGFSYGTALGQYYANMFPDRVRAIVVDGVINPKSWAGDKDTRETILDDRLRSADGAYKALREILERCGKAGAGVCAFAAAGDPVKTFDKLAKRLRAKPLVVEVPGGQPSVTTYADLVSFTLGSLYDPAGYASIVSLAQDLWVATEARGDGGAVPPAAAVAAAHSRLQAPTRAPDEPYFNDFEAYSGVTCTDALHPRDAASWPAKVVKSDRRAPYFGRAWAWSTSQCARDTWTVRDEDAYRGPFNRRTSAPVLVVGNYYDPATNYADAVSSSKLLKNARLLSSDSWGHTAYGTSACVTDAVDAYLVGVKLPKVGLTCVGDVQPFQETAQLQRRSGVVKLLPPVAPRVPRP
jgi:pimeloyl-ACP methyl ester carboxylesterase